MDNIEKSVIKKISGRLIPFLMLGYFVCMLDRGNIGVASLSMNDAIGLSAAAFGFGAGIFFIPYFLCEIPSNLALRRFGARVWIARIAISWGIVSGLHAFVWDSTSFYVIRALLGAAEAGFFPGILFYLSTWFPASYRGRVIAMFFAAVPITLCIGTPLSGFILTAFDGLYGMAGWKWMFIIEAIPSVIFGFAVLKYLPSKIEDAKWLDDSEKKWLSDRLDSETQTKNNVKKYGVLEAMKSPLVLALCLAYFGTSGLGGAVTVYLPQILKGFGYSNMQSTLVAAIPYLVAFIFMIPIGRLADKPGRRKLVTLFAFTISIVGLLSAAYADDHMIKLLALCLAAIGIYSSLPVFWSLPTTYLTGSAAAVAIAQINSLGSLSSFVNPWAMGYIQGVTGSFNGGLLYLGVMAIMAFIVILLIRHRDPVEEARVPDSTKEKPLPGGTSETY